MHQDVRRCAWAGIGRIKSMANGFGPLNNRDIGRDPENITGFKWWRGNQNGSRQAAGVASKIRHFAFVLVTIMLGADLGKSPIWQLICETLDMIRSKRGHRLVRKTNEQQSNCAYNAQCFCHQFQVQRHQSATRYVHNGSMPSPADRGLSMRRNGSA